MGFAVEMPDGCRYRMKRLVGKVPQKAGTLLQQLHHQPIQANLTVLHAGEKSPAHQFLPVGGELVQLSQDAPGVTAVGLYRPDGKQNRRRVLIVGNGGEDFFVGVAVKNAAEKALEAAVIGVDHFVHRAPPDLNGIVEQRKLSHLRLGQQGLLHGDEVSQKAVLREAQTVGHAAIGGEEILRPLHDHT
jgi:hypothetical protein